jgi:hypothetical protein
MQWYKANINGVISRKSKDPTVKSGEEVASFVKKGELLLVKNVEDLTNKNLSLPYKKYTLFNGNYAISIGNEEVVPYVRAGFADVPEYLFIQIQKPKVYITLGIILAGLATYSIIQERKNN